MKKNFTFTFLLLGFFTINAQTSFNEIKQNLLKKHHFPNFSKTNTTDRGAALCLPDSTISFQLDSTGLDSSISAKSYFTYNVNGDIIKQTNYQLNFDNVLELSNETISSYNAQNVLINDEYYTSNNNGGLELSSVTKYYPKGTSTTLLDSTVYWDVSFGVLDRSTKEVNTYNAAGNITQQIIYTWISGTGWEFSEKVELEYSPTGKNTKFTDFIWNDPNWDATTETVSTYDGLDSLTQQLSTDLVTNQPSERISFTYDVANKSQNAILENWNGTEWVFTLSVFIDLSASNQIEQTDFFIDFEGFFKFGSRNVFIFPNGNNCASFSNDYFTEDNEVWTYIGRTFYYYNGSLIPTNALTNNDLDLSATPNPFSDNLLIKTEIGSNVKVFSTTGSLFLERKSTDENTVLNTENLPIGAYFIVVNKNGKSDRKLVVKG
jgi:hypothetical protein